MQAHRTHHHHEAASTPRTTLHIYNLPLSVSEHDVIELLSCVGPVAKEHIALRRSWGDTGFNAYVTMCDEESASEVMHRCDGRQFFGQTLRVKRARHHDHPVRGPHTLQ